MKIKLTHGLLGGFCLFSLLLILVSCSSKMDELTAFEYFKESPAVTLYSTCSFEEEQPDLKADFLGKNGKYYYKAYNYKLVGIGKFQVTDDSATGLILLEPANETAACRKFDAQRKNTPHKAQVETKMTCSFQFKKIDGKWRLVDLQSPQYLRGYWDKKAGCGGTKYKDLIDLDVLRYKDPKSYEY